MASIDEAGGKSPVATVVGVAGLAGVDTDDGVEVIIGVVLREITAPQMGWQSLSHKSSA